MGVRWRGSVISEWGRRKWQFSLLSLAISSEPSNSTPQLLYSTMQSVRGSSMTPKQMTLNCQFALKCVSGSVSNGLAFWISEKTVRKFAELRI